MGGSSSGSGQPASAGGDLPVKAGDVLAGKYRVERVLGVGGMGMVVAAKHLELEELRAIKLMLPSVLDSPAALERFQREARAAARLRTEHVAKVLDVGRLDDGAPYLVMEHLEGHDLRTLLRRSGPLPAAVVALYGVQVCEALAEAHALGIVHRDLKPANLFLTHRHDGSPCIKVLDFGISKVLTGAEADLELTKTHEVLGSPLFMSPEQMQSIRSADARSDLWSLGIVLYVLAVGRAPFPGASVTEVISAVFSTTPAPPSKIRPQIPAAFDEVVLRCLRRDREERYQTATELAAALRALVPAADAAAARLSFAALPAPEREPVPAPATGGGTTTGPSAAAVSAPTPFPGVVDPAVDRTGASWGNTSSHAPLRSRSRRIAVGVGAGVVLAAGVAGALRLWLASPGTPAREASAPAQAATPAVTTTATPVVTPAEPVPQPPPTSSAAPAASASAPKPSRRPAPRPADDADPFGNGRK